MKPSRTLLALSSLFLLLHVFHSHAASPEQSPAGGEAEANARNAAAVAQAAKALDETDPQAHWGYVFGDVTHARFVDEFWQQRHLHVPRNLEAYFDAMYSPLYTDLLVDAGVGIQLQGEDVDLTLKRDGEGEGEGGAGGKARDGVLDDAKKKAAEAKKKFEKKHGKRLSNDDVHLWDVVAGSDGQVKQQRYKLKKVTPTRVAKALQRGRTVVVRMLNYRWYSVARVAYSFTSNLFGLRTNAHLFIVPPKKSDFLPRQYEWDQIITQVSGSANVKLYRLPRRVPRPDQISTDDVEVDDEPQHEITLNPGDVLYVPRGWIMQSDTVGFDASVQVRFMIEADVLFSWQGLFHTALAEVQKEEYFRRKKAQKGLIDDYEEEFWAPFPACDKNDKAQASGVETWTWGDWLHMALLEMTSRMPDSDGSDSAVLREALPIGPWLRLQVADPLSNEQGGVHAEEVLDGVAPMDEDDVAEVTRMMVERFVHISKNTSMRKVIDFIRALQNSPDHVGENISNAVGPHINRYLAPVNGGTAHRGRPCLRKKELVQWMKHLWKRVAESTSMEKTFRRVRTIASIANFVALQDQTSNLERHLARQEKLRSVYFHNSPEEAAELEGDLSE